MTTASITDARHERRAADRTRPAGAARAALSGTTALAAQTATVTRGLGGTDTAAWNPATSTHPVA
ncbi:MAG TPA: hypothetical protein VF204_09150 [Streptosporangiaceae bacterium]